MSFTPVGIQILTENCKQTAAQNVNKQNCKQTAGNYLIWSMFAVAKGPSSILHPDQGFQLGIGGDQDTTPVQNCKQTADLFINKNVNKLSIYLRQLVLILVVSCPSLHRLTEK